MVETATPLTKSGKPRARRGEGDPARQAKPRPAYILVNLPEGVTAADVHVVSVERKAEAALEAIDAGKAGAYIRVMVK